jgi:hypothetical protein
MKDFLNWKLTCRMHALGYDGPTLMYIDDEEDLINDDTAELIGAKPAILFSAAFRWFREKHNLGHMINGIGFESFVINVGGIVAIFNVKTYEEAELACLKKLIEIVKKQ